MGKYVMFFGFCYIVLTIICGMSEQTFIGTTQTTNIDILFAPIMMIANGDFNMIEIGSAVLNGDYLGALWATMWFDYAIFNTGWFVIFRYLFMVVPLGFVITLILTIFNRNST